MRTFSGFYRLFLLFLFHKAYTYGLHVPDRRKIPEVDIIMETRKGVALSYAPEQVAI